MGIRNWIEEAPATRSIILGSFFGCLMYIVPYGLEITIMFAMMMPGVYCGFAIIVDQNYEIIQETIITTILAYIFGMYCYPKVADGNSYYAPLAVFIHGIVDFTHHFKLFPSSKHVQTCCHKYPIICGCFDFALAIFLSLMIYIFE